MDIKKLVDQLHTLERKVLPLLEKHTTTEDLVKVSNLQEVEVTRALQWLENKGVLTIQSKEYKLISVTEKSKGYKELPERVLISFLSQEEISVEEIKKKSGLNDAEVNACIGLLKKKNIIEIRKDKDLKIKLNATPSNKKTQEEELFSKLLKTKLNENSLNEEEKSAFEELRKRGLVNLELHKERSITLTDLGKQVIKQKIDQDVIEALTPAIIKSKEWEKKKFRAYDIQINVPEISRGKRHFVDQSIDYIKRIWLDLGFKEMEGNITQTSFWCLDALFVPQDHTAREMQDTFFIGNKGSVLKGSLPEEYTKRIKSVHEDGWTTGSKGWGGVWKEDIAKDILLRTHTTVLSALTLSNLKKEDLPAKFFTVGKVYRNEALDWKHLFEFYQVEGIVIDPDANLRNLLGYLREFYKKMGYEDVKIRPSYFPYVEPACEVFAFNPLKRQWVEVGGAGIFRPEVTKALLGFECPVLAWGQGMERIITAYYNISDLREIYGNDLKKLKETKEFLM